RDGGRRDPAAEGFAGATEPSLSDRHPAGSGGHQAGRGRAGHAQGNRGIVLDRPGAFAVALQRVEPARRGPATDHLPKGRPRLLAGERPVGGVVGYPLDLLYEEVAFIAYHFHWPHGEVINLEHGERRRWVAEISTINGRLNEEPEADR